MLVRKTVDTLLRKFEKGYATHNRIEVSRSAILHNFDLFTSLDNRQIIPVLKGNAYGHGIPLVAKILKERNVPYIAVDGYFEALRVREVSNQPVLIMGAILPKNYAHLKYNRFAFVVDTPASIHALGTIGKRVKVHLEINTGMNRYGATPQDVIQLTQLILSYKNLELEGVMSHLADSDGTSQSTVVTAVRQFDSCVEAIRKTGAHPKLLHIAQSAGSVRVKSKYANAIRLGIGLYGINPFPMGHQLHSQLKDLQPALRLVSTITKTIMLHKGDRVSYNYTFTAPKAMTIGILPLGYYEGINRQLSNAGIVSINGQYAPIVGRVCMNHAMISLEGVSAKAGTEVTIYSNNPADQNTIETIASTHGLFTYNLLTALSTDVRRVPVP